MRSRSLLDPESLSRSRLSLLSFLLLSSSILSTSACVYVTGAIGAGVGIEVRAGVGICVWNWVSDGCGGGDPPRELPEVIGNALLP